MNPTQRLLRKLPGIDKLLGCHALTELGESFPHDVLTKAARETVERLRAQILESAEDVDASRLDLGQLAAEAAKCAQNLMRPNLRPVINATGTLLHTNLGRAPLAETALQAINETARMYSNLELDLKSGKRGLRHDLVADLLCQLTGAEAAMAVNNNAGAVYLALTALAQGREGVVSRGELVEIGGAFRIPDVMAASGVRLVEVGTTNKTHPRDYLNAISEETGLFLKVHTSNFRVVGFTAQVSGAELVEIARPHGIAVMEDLGSGMLFDLSAYGLPREPTVAEAVAAGIDVVTFSGDKLLGGPQAGIIVGRRELIEKIRAHPMARALRMDKLTLASLEATLRLYLDRERALREVPVLRMLATPAEELEQRCIRLARRARDEIGGGAHIEVVAAPSTVGGGALPTTELPGFAMAVTPREQSVDALARRLRHGQPAVVARAQDDRLLFNVRTLATDQENDLVTALIAALDRTHESD
jgi:L-seryl-tRNA(Ser) seleniumtransferase